MSLASRALVRLATATHSSRCGLLICRPNAGFTHFHSKRSTKQHEVVIEFCLCGFVWFRGSLLISFHAKPQSYCRSRKEKLKSRLSALEKFHLLLHYRRLRSPKKN